METELRLEQEVFPEGYSPKLDFFETERAIKLVKDTFERCLAERLDLQRVSAPRFLVTGTGLQDDLAGLQTPVGFTTRFDERPVEMVHSLAKWKRYSLGRYGFASGKGLYTDMDAIRKDEEVSPIHSVYVDQWDWEKVMSREGRSLDYLNEVVRSIYSALKDTERAVGDEFGLESRLPEDITFVHTEDLEERYPSLSQKGREHEVAKEYGAVFLIGIGHPLKSGEPHDARAADYDDWSTPTGDGKHGLNGDIIVWDSVRGTSLELSSMGIRVDETALLKQLGMMGQYDRKDLEFQKSILDGTTPLSVGGGIGQSRICMYLLQKAHIGEVQSSHWPEYVKEEFGKRGVHLL